MAKAHNEHALFLLENGSGNLIPLGNYRLLRKNVMKNTLLFTPAKSLDHEVINPENLVTALNFKKLIFLSIISGFIWVAVASQGSWVTWLGFFTVVSLIFYSTILLFQKKFVPSLSFLMYLAIIQPIVRTYVPSFPYLGFEYFFLFWSFIVLVTSPNSNQKKPVLLSFT